MPLQTVHRPKTLDDIAGNESIVESLKSVLSRETDVPHSYMFVGPAGCGKSTFARIIKNELGCSDSDFYLFNNSNLRGIDTIRDIEEAMQYSPINGPVKIFNLEECHMLTGPAQESLLVKLEEPPDHVFIILCTTEPQKLKPTIIRRCHKYEVKPLDESQLNKLLNSVLIKEDLASFPDKILNKIVEVSNGSPGRALNLLDTIIDMTDDDRALQALEDASVSESNIAEIARKLLSGNSKWLDIAYCIKGLSGDPESLRYAFLGYFRTVLLNSSGKKADQAAGIQMEFVDSVMYSGAGGLALEIYLAWKASFA